MPKPVKNKGKRPSSDPNRRAHQLLNDHLERIETSQKPWDADPAPPQGDPFKKQLSAYMSKLGAKGGKVSGAKRMENLSAKTRKAIAKRAAAARWSKPG